jgi:hypothetical protein
MARMAEGDFAAWLREPENAAELSKEARVVECFYALRVAQDAWAELPDDASAEAYIAADRQWQRASKQLAVAFKACGRSSTVLIDEDGQTWRLHTYFGPGLMAGVDRGPAILDVGAVRFAQELMASQSGKEEQT